MGGGGGDPLCLRYNNVCQTRQGGQANIAGVAAWGGNNGPNRTQRHTPAPQPPARAWAANHRHSGGNVQANLQGRTRAGSPQRSPRFEIAVGAIPLTAAGEAQAGDAVSYTARCMKCYAGTCGRVLRRELRGDGGDRINGRARFVGRHFSHGPARARTGHPRECDVSTAPRAAVAGRRLEARPETDRGQP